MTSSDPNDRVRAVLDTERGRLAREASTLFIELLERSDDEALKARIEQWCAESEANRAAWQSIRRTYGRLGEVPAAHRSVWHEPAVTPTARMARKARSRPARRRHLMGGAIVAAVACVALVAGPSVLLSLRSDHTTATAESRTVALDDGSHVRLAPESALQVAYSAGERRVRLLKGEAFFEVMRDERRPFAVVAGDVVTTVLGTAFDVRLDGHGTDVSVQSGRVHVAANTKSPPVSQELGAGETLQVKTDGRLARAATAPEDVAAWRTETFVARARPIGEIVEALRRYYDGIIVVRDEAFLARRVSGAYDLRTPALTLRSLALAHDAAMRQVTPWLMIVTAR